MELKNSNYSFFFNSVQYKYVYFTLEKNPFHRKSANWSILSPVLILLATLLLYQKFSMNSSLFSLFESKKNLESAIIDRQH